MKTGTRKEPDRLIKGMEIDVLVCDKCGADATNRTPCDICKKDLCSKHQIDTIYDISSGVYSHDPKYDVKRGLYCRECLIQAILETFPE